MALLCPSLSLLTCLLLLLFSSLPPSLSAFVDVDWSIDSSLQSLLNDAVQPGIASLVISTSPASAPTLTTPLSSSSLPPTSPPSSSPSSPPPYSCPFTPLAHGSAGWRRADAPIHSRTPLLSTDAFPLAHPSSLLALLLGQHVELLQLDFNANLPTLFPYLRFNDSLTPSTPNTTNAANATGFFARSPHAANLTVHASWRNVSLAHLLMMTSGLSVDPVSGPCPWARWSAMEGGGEVEEGTGYPVPSRRALFACLLRSVIAQPPAPEWWGSPVGWRYSAEGLLVAAMVVEEKANQVWEAVVQSQLFTRLNLTTTGWDIPPTPPLTQPAAYPVGHAYVPTTDSYSSDPSLQPAFPHALRPAIAVHASLHDWARYVACWLPSLSTPWIQSFPPASNPNPFIRPSSWRVVSGRPQLEARPMYGAGALWNYMGTLEVSATSFDPTGTRALSYMGLGNVGSFCSALFVFPQEQVAVLSASNACEVYRNVSDWMLVRSGQVLYAQYLNKSREWREANTRPDGAAVWNEPTWAIVTGGFLVVLLVGVALGYWLRSSPHCMGRLHKAEEGSGQALLS